MEKYHIQNSSGYVPKLMFLVTIIWLLMDHKINKSIRYILYLLSLGILISYYFDLMEFIFLEKWCYKLSLYCLYLLDFIICYQLNTSLKNKYNKKFKLCVISLIVIIILDTLLKHDYKLLYLGIFIFSFYTLLLLNDIQKLCLSKGIYSLSTNKLIKLEYIIGILSISVFIDKQYQHIISNKILHPRDAFVGIKSSIWILILFKTYITQSKFQDNNTSNQQNIYDV